MHNLVEPLLPPIGGLVVMGKKRCLTCVPYYSLAHSKFYIVWGVVTCVAKRDGPIYLLLVGSWDKPLQWHIMHIVAIWVSVFKEPIRLICN